MTTLNSDHAVHNSDCMGAVCVSHPSVKRVEEGDLPHDIGPECTLSLLVSIATLKSILKKYCEQHV